MSRALVGGPSWARRIVMIGVALGLLLTGCGDGDPVTTPDQPGGGSPTEQPGGEAEPTNQPGATGEACDYLTPQAIERAIGMASGAGRLDDQLSSDRHDVCMFDLADGGWVQVVYEPGGDATRHRATAETMGEFETQDVDELPGGYYVPDLGAMGAQAGSDFAQVALHLDAGEATREQLVALMQELLAAR